MSSGFKGWVDDLTGVCAQFQVDLSCLVDGELDEVAAARAITHMEDCSACREFLDDVRMQVSAHKDLTRPDALLEQYSELFSSMFHDEIETIELVHRLSTIFYQLGKAYVLSATDPGFKERVFAHQRVFEDAVPLRPAQIKGRGFVDGVLARGAGGSTGADWRAARHMLNGKLEKIEDPLQKGRRLLDEAVRVDPTHEEARIYLAFLDAREGKTIRAAQAFRHIFRVAVDQANRGHAAIQLGLLYEEQDELRKAIACNRWIVMSGLAEDDPRFFVARFNLAAFHARSGNPRRSLRAFRDLLDLHPDKRDDIVRLLGRSPRARAAIDLQPGFAVALLETCPELFGSPEGGSDPSGSEETA